MARRRVHRAFIGVVCAATLLAASSRPAEAASIGTLAGFYQSDVTFAGNRVDLSVESSDGRRITGEVMLNVGTANEVCIDFKATLSESGQFNLVGMDVDGRIVVHGKFDGTLLEASYRLFVGGTIDHGDLHVVVEQSSPPQFDVTGEWHGSYQSQLGSTGEIVFAIRSGQQMPEGTLMVVDKTRGIAFAFNIFVSVNGDGSFAMTGLGPAGLFTTTGQLKIGNPIGEISGLGAAGKYEICFVGGDMDAGVFDVVKSLIG